MAKPTGQILNKIRAEKLVEPVSKMALDEYEDYSSTQNKVRVSNTVNLIVVWGLGILAVVVGLIILIRLWHLIGFGCRWLSQEDINSIDSLLELAFYSSFGGLVTNYIKNNINSEKRSTSE